MADKILITAHSGSNGTPDNSLECVRYALTTGADALEIDVRAQPDGTLSLGHDSTDASAPTLREVFRLAAAVPGIKVNCDLKERGLEQAVCTLAEQCGMKGRIIFSGSVDVDTFNKHPELHECAEIYLNIEEYVPDLYVKYRDIPDFELEAAAAITEVCRAHEISTVNMYQGIITRRFIHTLVENGLSLSAWTVSEEPALAWFLSTEVRNITTRKPALALKMRVEAK